MWKAIKDINGVIGNPFKHDLEKYINAPDYASRVCFVERFHEDFKKVVDVYACGKRVFVFIDDLDRCEVPQAAELMKAINLMISDDPALFFILGVDRIKVAAGLAVKDKELIPYLTAKESSKVSTEEGNRDAIQGLIYGSEFIEKFIQVPFHIPRADPAKLQEMLNIDIQEDSKISNKELDRKPPDTDAKNREFRANDKNQADYSKNAETSKEQEKKEKLRRDVGLRLGTDSEEIKSIIQMVSKSLNCNPRRIKQFINLFRLRAYIAFETGVLKYPANVENKGFITLEQLGKIIAIAIQWPLLFKKAIENKDIIHMIASVAEGRKGGMDTGPIRPWEGDEKLMELVRANCQGNLLKRYSLDGVDIDKILEILPKITAIKERMVEEIKTKGEEKFISSRGIEELVQRSNYFGDSENIRNTILVFSTPQQHTWLIATNQQIFFVLDDEDTRSSQRLIQYRLPLQAALPVTTKQDTREVGVFQLGASDWWYYSMDILGNPSEAKQRLELFVKTVMGQ
jgi:hypothetical protein